MAQIFPKTLARESDLPGSPGGWGAVDPTRAECESDSEEELPPLPPLSHGVPPRHEEPPHHQEDDDQGYVAPFLQVQPGHHPPCLPLSALLPLQGQFTAITSPHQAVLPVLLGPHQDLSLLTRRKGTKRARRKEEREVSLKNMCPLYLYSLPIYSILGHHHQYSSSLLSSMEQISALSAFSPLSHRNILRPHHHLEE